MDTKHPDKPVSGPPQGQEKSLLASLIESPSFQKSFSELGTASEQIKFVLAHDTARMTVAHIVDSLKGKSSNDQKDGNLATFYGQEGSRAFEAQHYKEALLSYSESIRYAPHDSGLLPIAFGNRSGTFFQWAHYEAALKDIEAAQSHAQYKPYFMLTIRKCQCLVRLGCIAEAKKILSEIKPSELNKSDAALLAKFYKQEGEKLKDVDEDEEGKEDEQSKKKPELLKDVPSVIKILSEKGRFEPQSDNSSLSSKVEVRYDEKNGRHLVTTEEVHFGDILAVTKPYASLLNEKQELHFCHHCLVSLKPFSGIFFRSIPCTQCTRVLYCSEHCRTQSWQSYHRFECILPAKFVGQRFTQFSSFCLAWRAIFAAGGLESIRAVAQKLATEGGPSKSADFTHNPQDYYENVYRMAMKEGDSLQEQIYTVIHIISLFKWFQLAATGEVDIFEGSSPDISPLEKDVFAIETLLRHYQKNRGNISLFVRSDHSTMNHATANSESITTLDPVISLVCKSCDPNISIISVDCANAPPHVSNVSVFFAVKPMAAGTLLTCVGPSYGDSMKLGIDFDDFARCRQRSWNETGYLCPCEHCEGKRRDSPLGSFASTALDGYEFFCGSTCGGLIRRTEDNTDQVKCCTCKREIDQDELAKLKKICSDIFKMHSQAIASIARINTLIKTNNNKMQANLSKELTTALLKLETLITDRIAPLALNHCRLMLVDLYKQLNSFYRYCNDLDKPTTTNLAYLQKAWKYAEASHTTLLVHFGGNSLGLMRLLLENVGIFSHEMIQVKCWLMNWIDYCHCMNENKSGPDQNRIMLTGLMSCFFKAKARLERLKDCYNLI